MMGQEIWPESTMVFQALVHVIECVPLASYVHCKSHCINLAVVHTCKLQCVRTMMKTVQDIGFAFSYSGSVWRRLSELSVDPVTRALEADNEDLVGEHVRAICEPVLRILFGLTVILQEVY